MFKCLCIMTSIDYLKIYSLEKYIFEDINKHFRCRGWLFAEELFCIVIWKANRAKSKIAEIIKDKRKGRESFQAIVKRLTGEIFRASTNKEKMRLMIKEWGFSLPMASAILTALYPDDFTVYDTRVCSIIDTHKHLSSRKVFDNLWQGYEEYKSKVKSYDTGGCSSLRDKDRYLWGMSFYIQLEEDVKNEVQKKNNA